MALDASLSWLLLPLKTKEEEEETRFFLISGVLLLPLCAAGVRRGVSLQTLAGQLLPFCVEISHHNMALNLTINSSNPPLGEFRPLFDSCEIAFSDSFLLVISINPVCRLPTLTNSLSVTYTGFLLVTLLVLAYTKANTKLNTKCIHLRHISLNINTGLQRQK